MKVCLSMRNVLLLCVCLVCCWGCSMFKSAEKWYRGRINTVTHMDLTVQADEECAPKGFADAFVPIDTRLDMMGRELAAQDVYPRDEWFDAFVAEYPWIDSITAVNVHGEVLTSRGQGASLDVAPAEDKELVNYAALTHGDPLHRIPTAHILSGKGAEKRLALSMPFFKNNTWKGCLVVVFGFQKIVKFAASPDDIVILDASGASLWPGRYEGIMDAVAGQPWKEWLEDVVSGVFTVQDKEFFWLGRAFAGTWLIYTSERYK